MGQTKEQFQAALLLFRDMDPCWPGFAPASTPFLVFSGQDTHLLGAVPPVLSGWSQADDDWIFGGRHPQVYANTALLLDDVLPVATLLLDELPGDLTSRQLAAIAAHARDGDRVPGTGPVRRSRLAGVRRAGPVLEGAAIPAALR